MKDTIARGVRESRLAYVGKAGSSEYEPFYYGENLNTDEVELSDDMFLLTKEAAEEYKKRIEQPPTLTSIVITPERSQLQPGKAQTFMARGFDQYGHAIAVDKLVWTATGGSIDQDGTFVAGQEDGTFIVTATAGTLSTSASIVIAREHTPQPSFPFHPPQSQAAKTLRWTGNVPPQKWMNFYTKVLARFAASKGLTLTLTVEVTQEEGTSEQKIEETKVALRELGLKDDIEVH